MTSHPDRVVLPVSPVIHYLPLILCTGVGVYLFCHPHTTCTCISGICDMRHHPCTYLITSTSSVACLVALPDRPKGAGGPALLPGVGTMRSSSARSLALSLSRMAWRAADS